MLARACLDSCLLEMVKVFLILALTIRISSWLQLAPGCPRELSEDCVVVGDVVGLVVVSGSIMDILREVS